MCWYTCMCADTHPEINPVQLTVKMMSLRHFAKVSGTLKYPHRQLFPSVCWLEAALLLCGPLKAGGLLCAREVIFYFCSSALLVRVN